jgi:soluble lytic murein transglycosylase-like protein
MKYHRLFFVLVLLCFGCKPVFSRQAQYELLSLSNLQQLRDLADQSDELINSFQSPLHAIEWLGFQSHNTRKLIPDQAERSRILRILHYEAVRFSLDPDLVLALIEHESRFMQKVISPAGAVGLMQVMPFWKEVIGRDEDSLFEIRTNIRYGCLILRHYLDVEQGNVERALARYNGSLGRDAYPNSVLKLLTSKYRF